VDRRVAWSAVLSSLTEWVTDVVETLGYVGVAILVAIENLFPPIPSEVVLTLAGFVAGRGDAWVVGMIIAATIGSLIGAWLLYGIAAWVGPGRLRAFVRKYGKWFRITEDDLDKSEAWFDRRAGMAVLICRCIPLVRSLVSIPAGFRRMPLVPFTIYTVVGSFVWNTVLILVGYALGDQWEKAEKYVDYFQYAVILAILGGIGWFVYRRFITAKGAAPLAASDRADD
jgi:membrane protein DedA with SNARE-associated domain